MSVKERIADLLHRFSDVPEDLERAAVVTFGDCDTFSIRKDQGAGVSLHVLHGGSWHRGSVRKLQTIRRDDGHRA